MKRKWRLRRKKNMQRTHHKLVAGLPESQVTLSFSTDGRFTPPSSSSTETFLPVGTARGLWVILTLNVINQGKTRVFLVFRLVMLFQEKTMDWEQWRGELTLTHGILTSPARVWFRGWCTLFSGHESEPLVFSNYNSSFLSPPSRCHPWTLFTTGRASIVSCHAVLVGHLRIRIVTLMARASWPNLN